MWMMGCSDGNGFNMSDSFNTRILRPLIPKPATAIATNSSNIATTATTVATTSPCLSHIHGTDDLFALNHHLASVTEHSKREFNNQPVLVTSRWNPTPEQLRTLEELYRHGTRTPTAEQIQHITAQLRRFGKIEGKNVFYWFQNHKARERQKRRRRSESAYQELHPNVENLEKKESGSSRSGFEVEQTKNWAASTNCSTLAEESVSIEMAAKGAALVTDCRPDGWIQLEEEELQQRRRRSSVKSHATWQMMQLSSSPPSNNLINPTMTATAMETSVYPKLMNTQNINLFITPNREEDISNHLAGGTGYGDDQCGESQTLQLFPLRSDDSHGGDGNEETEMSIAAMNSDFIPYQFIEFLPLKN